MQLFIFSTLILYVLSFFIVIFYHLSPSPLSSPQGGEGRTRGKDIFEFLSKFALVVGLIFHTIVLAIRTYESGHAPMLAMYETLLFYGCSTCLLGVIVVFRYNERLTELITIPVAILAMVFAQLNETPPKPLTLILRTRWFETHVITSFAAYAFFTLAFAGAVLYLLYGFRTEGSGLKKDFQDIANRSVLWGFFFFSASMFAGAVWAYLAWGTYWLWEPKVIWSFIVWFYYAGAMHAYYVKEWRGNGLAVATVGDQMTFGSQSQYV